MSTRHPCLCSFVKSKCYGDDGSSLCKKEGHSCLRRVVDNSAVPFRRAWRVLGCGIRRVLESLRGEVFNPSLAASALTRSLNTLSCQSERCIKCNHVIPSSVSVFVADVGQAFECCNAAGVSRSWEVVAREFRSVHGVSSDQVQKGKRCVAKVGGEPWF